MSKQGESVVVLENPVTLKVKCQYCNIEHEVTVDQDDLNEYFEGGLAQRCFPYLNGDQRELLISRTCGKCWDKIFETMER